MNVSFYDPKPKGFMGCLKFTVNILCQTKLIKVGKNIQSVLAVQKMVKIVQTE